MNTNKILIVDDEPGIRMTVRTCLESAGYSTLEAADGAEALEKAQRFSPQLVLLDLAMPVMDGMSVLADIRNILPGYPIKVIVATAHGSVKTAIEAMRLGASDFLEKPFTPEELRSSVEMVLAKDKPSGYTADGYLQVLQYVRQSLREGKFKVAEQQLMKAGSITDDDAPFLNLAGVLHESYGRIDSARKFYERAVSKDRHYRPPKENILRLNELKQTGRTKRPVAFGDDNFSTQYTLRKLGQAGPAH